MMKKILAILLALVMLLGLTACGGDDPAPSEGTTEGGADSSGESESESETETEAPLADLVFVENGSAQYDIICENTAYKAVANNVQSVLKTKMGVEFKQLNFVMNEDIKHIFVGSDYNKLGLEGDMLTAGGYAVVEKDGNVYICGYEEAKVSRAAQEFLSSIVPAKHVTVNEAGVTLKAVVPHSAFLFFNPEYLVSNPEILGNHLSKYRIVIPKAANKAEKELATVLIKEISTHTGFQLTQVTDAVPVGTYEIIIGRTNRELSASLYEGLGVSEYRLKSEGNLLYVAYGSYLAYTSAIEALKGVYRTANMNKVELSGTVDEVYGLTKKDPKQIRVMSTNVLFTSTDRPPLSSDARQYVNAECYLTYMPDIIGVQEACANNRSILTAQLKDYYNVVDTNPSRHEFTPIYYLKDKYKVEESKFHSFDVKHCWSYSWARFSTLDENDDTEFIVMNLHYHYETTTTRLPGVQDVNAELKRLQSLYPDLPIMVTGDYNSRVDSTEHQTMFAGLTRAMAPGMTLTTDTGGRTAPIDHISVTTDNVTVETYRVINYQVITYGSDHLPVFVDLTFNKK